MSKRSFERAPLAARRAKPIPPPLIPIQLPDPFTPAVDPVKPFIPLQESSTGRLQHELAYITVGIPVPSAAALPAITEEPKIQFVKRQATVTTVTDVGVVVEDGNGSVIGTTTLKNVKSGSMTITFPGTTATLPPVASISSVVSLEPNSKSVALIPQQSPAPGVFTSMNSPGSGSPTSQQVLSSPLPTPTSPSSTTSMRLNNNMGMPSSSSTASAILNSSSSDGISITAAASAISLPTGLLTSISTSSNSSTLIGGASLSSGTSSQSSTFSQTTSMTTSSTSTGSLNGAGVILPTATGSIPAASSSTAAAAASSNPSQNITAPVVGGVVGGLAGLALILALLLFLVRWIRRRRSGNMALRSVDNESIPPGTAHSNAPMSQNPPAPALAGAGGATGAAGIGAMIKRMTGGSTATNETSTSERGFQNLGGRRLESVLTSGGDGFDDPAPSGAQTPNSVYKNWSERHPYETPSRHSSMVVGPATPFRRGSGHLAELAAASSSRPISGANRSTPARHVPQSPTHPAFVTESGNLSPPLVRPRPIDPLGRSRYSQDGSRGSKFTEDL